MPPLALHGIRVDSLCDAHFFRSRRPFVDTDAKRRVLAGKSRTIIVPMSTSNVGVEGGQLRFSFFWRIRQPLDLPHVFGRDVTPPARHRVTPFLWRLGQPPPLRCLGGDGGDYSPSCPAISLRSHLPTVSWLPIAPTNTANAAGMAAPSDIPPSMTL